MKRLLTLILVLALLCTCLSGVSAVPNKTIHLEGPLDRSAAVREDLSLVPRPQSRSAEDQQAIETLEEGAQILRDAMKAREGSIQLDVCVTDWSDDSLLELADVLFSYALVHTGVPNEGDYLTLSISYAEVAIDGEVVDDLGYFTLAYQVEYLTTASQESRVDTKVEKIMQQMDLDGKGEYEKLLAIYDHIRENVDYSSTYEEEASDGLQHTAFSGLINGSCTYFGFAAIVYRLALEAGVDCRVIAGTINDNDRVWNIARIGEVYYNLNASADNGSYYKYFLKCDADMTNHQRSEPYSSEEFYQEYPMSATNYRDDPCVHEYTVTVNEPTCFQGGYSYYYCRFCGYEFDGDFTEVLGHDYVGTVTEPTCQEKGYTTFCCSRCGDTYISKYTDPSDHRFSQWEYTTAVTCTKNGKQQRQCPDCGLTETRTVLCVGHSYVDGRCTVCGRRLSEGVQVPQKPVIRSCYSRVQQSVKTTWELVDGADGYELWRTTDPDDPESWTKTKTINSATSDRYTNQGLTVGVTYYYKVRAFVNAPDGSKVYSPFSELNYMPAAVVFDSPYSNRPDRVRLRWDEVGGSHGYQIWRLQSDGSWKLIKTLGDKGNTLTDDQGATTAYTNTGVPAGSVQTYRMRAFRIREDGKKVFGAYSDEVSVVVKPVAPNFQAISYNPGQIEVTWEDVEGASGYQTHISMVPDDGRVRIEDHVQGYGNYYCQYGLICGFTYAVKMRTYIEVGDTRIYSDYSEPIIVDVPESR